MRKMLASVILVLATAAGSVPLPPVPNQGKGKPPAPRTGAFIPQPVGQKPPLPCTNWIRPGVCPPIPR